MMRAAWIVLLAGIGVVATGAEVDRSARYNPTLAQFVPDAVASFALPHHALNALSHSTPADALARAQLLVERRPIPAENLSILAAAEQRAGNDLQSLADLQIAAHRGWRDRAAQHGMFDIAYAAHDYDEAGSRLAALWGVDQDRTKLVALSRTLLSTPEGRQAFAKKLMNGGNWREAFLTVGRESLPSDAFADTIRSAIAGGASFKCNNLEVTIRYFASKHEEPLFPASMLDRCEK